MKKNNGEKLSNAMSYISNDLITESVNAKRSVKGISVKKIVAIACAAAILTAAIPTALILSLKNKIGNGYESNPLILSAKAYESGSAVLPDELSTVKITAEGVDGSIISTDGSFIIETSGETDVKTITEYVSVKPTTAMAISQIDGKTFKLTPASGTLTSGAIYKLSVGDPDNPAVSYAFQTEKNLTVKSILPADLALNVPVDTGIEITFSDSVKGCDFEKYIEISPKAKGEFILYPDGRTVAFVPKSNLSFDTVYTVTVSSEITGVSGKKLSESKTASFRTDVKASEVVTSGALYLTTDSYSDNIFASNSEVSVDAYIFGCHILSYGDLNWKMYKFPSLEKAAEMMLEKEKKLGDGLYSDVPYDVSKLEFVKNGKTQIMASYDTTRVSLGDSFNRGIYLVEITANATAVNLESISSTRYVIVQISDVVPYTVSSDGQTLLYLYDVLENSCEGAEVNYINFNRISGWNANKSFEAEAKQAKTDRDGLVMLDTGKYNSSIVTIKCGENEGIYCVRTAKTDNGNYYLKYIYTDREVYFSNDKVNFFGFVSNAYGGEIPKTLYLQTGNSVIKTPIAVNEDGTFNGEYLLEQVSDGGLYLKLCDENGSVIVSKYIKVTTEAKPIITAEITTDNFYYEHGDTIKGTLKATFFDGTPVPNKEFYFSCNHFCVEGDFITDENGEIHFTIQTSDLSLYSTDYITLTITAELIGFETQTLTVTENVYFFNSDYVYDVTHSGTEPYATLYRRDMSKIKTESDLLSNYPENIKGEAVSGYSVDYVLTKCTLRKTLKTGYNTFSKKSYSYFSYSIDEDLVEKGSVSFEKGTAKLKVMPKTDTVWYYYDTFFEDPSNSSCVYERYVSATKYQTYYTSNNNTELEKIGIVVEDTKYSIGEKITATFTDGGENKKALFFTVGNGIHKYAVTENFVDTFDSSLVNYSRVYAAYFSPNKGMFVTDSASISYDYADFASAKITVESDKEKYKPGESAVISVHSDGLKNGIALISVVDEACFALGEQTVNIFDFFGNSTNSYEYDDYYSYYYYRRFVSAFYGTQYKAVLLNSRFSNTEIEIKGISLEDSGGILYNKKGDAAEEIDLEPSADRSEKTGKESSSYYIRKYFADNPEFKIVELDENGNGTLVMTVPDNITSWRLTICAAGNLGGDVGEIKVGNSVSDIICTQPYFINLGINSQYLVGDEISLSVRSYGANAQGKAKYTAVLYDCYGNEIATKKANDECLDRAWIKFGSLEAGEYSVTVYGECGDSTDAVQSTFVVINSAITVDVRKMISSGDVKNLNPSYYPITLTFINQTKTNALYDSVVSRLKYSTELSRADGLVSYYVANKVSEMLYGTEGDLDAIVTRLSSYGGNGLVSLLTYSEGDAKLTADLLSLDSSVFTSSRKENLISFLYSKVSTKEQDSPEELCQNLCSLSALGEPILDRLSAVCDIAGGFSTEAKLYLALAFSNCGDWNSARAIYDIVVSENGVRDNEYKTLYIKADSVGDQISLSSLALSVAARVCREDGEYLINYLMGAWSNENVCYIGLASYLKYYLPTEKVSDKEFTYTVGGEEQKITLKVGRCYCLTLYKADYEKLDITSIDEGIAIRAAYKGKIDDALENSNFSDRVKIDKSYVYLGDGTCRVTLTISGTSTRISESFEIDDIIPSGARFVSTYGSYSNGDCNTSAWIYNSAGQKMNGYVSLFNYSYWKQQLTKNKYFHTFTNVCPEYSFAVTVEYTIRGAVEGEFICESALVRNYEANIFSTSQRQILNISENGKWTVKIAK